MMVYWPQGLFLSSVSLEYISLWCSSKMMGNERAYHIGLVT